jgi:hypothetical protein
VVEEVAVTQQEVQAAQAAVETVNQLVATLVVLAQQTLEVEAAAVATK